MNTLMGRLGALTLVAAIAFAGALGLDRAFATDSTAHLFDRQQLQVSTGTATINSGTANYANWQPLVTITPDASNANALQDLTVVLDLNQATTGFGAVYTSATINVSIQRKVDGTNWREATNLATGTISGTTASAATGSLSVELKPGLVGPGESVQIAVIISSVNNTNVTIPYVVYYRAAAKATITAAS